MNKLELILNNPSEMKSGALYKILYSAHTKAGVSALVGHVSLKKAIQNLEDYFNLQLILQGDNYYCYEDSKVKKVFTVSELMLAIELTKANISVHYIPVKYHTITGYQKGTTFDVFIHKSVDQTKFFHIISEKNAKTLIEILKVLIEDIKGSSLEDQQTQYQTHILTTTEVCAQYSSESFDSAVVLQHLQDFESNDGKVFNDTIKQYNLDKQAELDKLDAQRKNILTLWKMVLLIGIPLLIFYLYSK